ncbi:MAG: signal peptide peptidase SppA [Armatimonadota bacterium]
MSDDERPGDLRSPEEEPAPVEGTEPQPEETEAVEPAEPPPAAPEAPAAAPVPPPPPPHPPPHGPYATPAGYAPPAAYAPPPGYQQPAPTYVQPQRRRSPLTLILGILVGLTLVFLLFGALLSGGGSDSGAGLGLSRVGVITIEGVIKDGGRGGLFSGPAGSRAIMQQVREAKNDSETKAVLLLINSPGGTPAASHAIWQEVMKLKARKKVVVCMTDVCASGGYYVASAADRIVAQGSTLTGSIGVIMGGIGYYGLMDKLGLTDQTVIAGKYKDVGSGQRPMTAQERQYLNSMLQDVYNQFINAIAEGRKMDRAKVRLLAEGRIYTGNQAKAVGLVDELGNYYDAVKLAGKLGGITGEPRIKHYGESRGLFSSLMAESIVQRLFGTRSFLEEPPLQGPMLVLPYTYQMVPMVRGQIFDLK